MTTSSEEQYLVRFIKRRNQANFVKRVLEYGIAVSIVVVGVALCYISMMLIFSVVYLFTYL